MSPEPITIDETVEVIEIIGTGEIIEVVGGSRDAISIHGRVINSAAPSNDDVYAWDSTAEEWTPKAIDELAGGFVNVTGDTMTGPLVIDGGVDEIQLRVQGNATQTADIAVFEKSDGTDVVAISEAGIVVTGTQSVSGALTATGGVDGVIGGVTPAAGTFTSVTSVLVQGGTGSGDDLQLSSTSNATKGLVYVGSTTAGFIINEAGTQVSIGTAETDFTIGGVSKSSVFVTATQGGANAYDLIFHRHSSNSPVFLGGLRSRGSHAAPGDIQAGDVVFEIHAFGFENDDYEEVSGIAFEVDAAGTVASNIVPGLIRLHTTDAAGATVDALVLDFQQVATFGSHVVPTGAADIGLTGTRWRQVYADDMTVTTDVTASTFTGALVGNADTATALATARLIGNVSFDGTANIVPETMAVVDSTDASSSIAMFDSATGNLQAKTDAGLTYDASTGILTATGFAGPLNGTVGATTPATGAFTTITASSTGTFTGDLAVLSGAGLVVGHTGLFASAGANTEFQIHGTGSNDSSLTLGRWSANSGPLAIRFYRSRSATIDGTNSAGTRLVGGDDIGNIMAFGDDGVDDNTNVASIEFECEGTISAGQVPGVILLRTAAIGSLATVLKLDSSKVAAFQGAVTIATGTLTASGGGALTGTWTDLGTVSAATSITSTVFVGPLTGAVTGNADTATALETARLIGNVSFDGTANIVPETMAVVDSTDATSFVAMFDSATGNLQAKTDAGITYDAVTAILTVTGGASFGGTTFIGGATSNADMSLGLTIDQDAFSNEALALKANAVDHGFVSGAETDTYANWKKHNVLAGGLLNEVYNENAANQIVYAVSTIGGQASTTKSTSGRSLMEFQAAPHDGADAIGNVPAGANIFGVRARVGGSYTSLFIVGQGGSTWQAGNITAVDATLSGNLSVVGTALFTSTITLTGSGATVLGGTLAAGATTLKADSTGLASVLFVNNEDTSANANSSRVTYQFKDTSSNLVTGAAFTVTKEQVWTSTASTQDAKMAWAVTINGALTERMILDSAGLLTVNEALTVGTATVTGTLTATLTGNADTATALATARTIGGVSFDGTANIVPQTIQVVDSTDATSSIAMFDSATGNLQAKTDAGLTYDASTGILTATGLAGPLNGTVGATTPASGAFTTLTASSTLAVTGLSTLSGRLSLPDGAVGDPAIIFTSDTNTGIYNISNNVIGFAANAVLSMQVDPTGVVIPLALAVTGTSQFTGNIGINLAPTGFQKVVLGGSFTSDGSGVQAYAFKIQTAITGAAGDTSQQALFSVDGTITTSNTAETVADAMTMFLEEPQVTVGTGGTVTNATTLKINAAPSTATNNRAFWVLSGATDLGGTLAVTGASTLTGDVGIGEAASSSVRLTLLETAASQTALFKNSHGSSPFGVHISFTGAAPDDTTSSFLRMSDNAGAQAWIYSDGSYQGSANSYGALSDRRLKQNVESLGSNWDRYRELDWSSFEMIAKPERAMRGLIAQDVYDIFPHCVYQSGEDDMYAINYMGITIETGRVVVEAIERIETIEEWRDEVTDWRSQTEIDLDAARERIVRLEKQVAELEKVA